MDLDIPGYKLQREVGCGGMAKVYTAIQTSFDRTVAVKILSPSKQSERVEAERFVAEAKTVATLNHPNIVPVYDAGKVGDYYYIAMEYLSGNTLSHWIQSGMEEAEKLRVVREMADALYYAHGKGVIHRDIKPDNIMFRENFSAVLSDFGISTTKNDKKHLTIEGNMIGTPSYMSPEQARAKELDGRADLYSLGVVFYEMLTKKLPYDAPDPMAQALAHISEPVPTLPVQFSVYQELIDKMMAKKPEQRFQTGMELCKVIQQFELNSLEAKSVSRTTGNQKRVSVSLEQERSSLSLEATEPGIAESSSQASPVESSSTVPSGGEGLSIQGMSVDFEEKNYEAKPSKGRGKALPSKNLVVEIEDYRALLFMRRSRISIQLVSEEVSQFNVQFGQVASQIMAWYEDYGPKARSLHLTFYCNPWLAEKIQNTVNNLMEAHEPYEFLSKAKAKVVFFDLAGEPL